MAAYSEDEMKVGFWEDQLEVEDRGGTQAPTCHTSSEPSCQIGRYQRDDSLEIISIGSKKPPVLFNIRMEESGATGTGFRWKAY